MTPDAQTNFLYISELLTTRHQDLWQSFEPLLKDRNIGYALLQGTRDVWCRDYMPVQINQNRFVQFVYQPGYLQPKKWRSSISDPAAICQEVGIETTASTINLDGGNVVRSGKRAILTDRIFTENPLKRDKIKLKNNLQDLLEVERLDIIPRQPFDFTGHADGMVRFLDDETLLINEDSSLPKWYKPRLKYALKQTGLNLVPYTYNPDLNGGDSAIGTYINFLQIGKVIFLPEFNLPESDEKALRQTKELYPDCKVVPVTCNEIALKGGVLNCISWNVQQ